MENPRTVVDSSASTAAEAALTTLCNSIQALGRGFDVTSDIRLLYCKGASGARLVHVDEENTRDLVISHGLVLPNVSADVDFSRGKIKRETTPVLTFHEVMGLFRCGVFVFLFFFMLIWVCLGGWILKWVYFVCWIFCGFGLNSLCIFGFLYWDFYFLFLHCKFLWSVVSRRSCLIDLLLHFSVIFPDLLTF